MPRPRRDFGLELLADLARRINASILPDNDRHEEAPRYEEPHHETAYSPGPSALRSRVSTPWLQIWKSYESGAPASTPTTLVDTEVVKPSCRVSKVVEPV